MHQFFVAQSQIQDNEVIITGNDVNHIRHVLRMKAGEEIAVSNGCDGKEYRCAISEIGEERVVCDLMFIREEGVELPSKVFLFQGLPKGDKMELIIQKAVELGVFEIIPMETKRCIVKLDGRKAEGKLRRWQAISEAAAKQSKRQTIPEVKAVMSYEEALDYARGMDVAIIPYELASDMKNTKDIVECIKPNQSIAVFIGSEGGFEEKEIEKAKNAGVSPVTMGKRILRTETAGMTILAWIMYQLES